MRVFVTGATGFIGSHLVRHLLESGYEITALVRTANRLAGGREVLGTLESANPVELLKGHDALIHNALIWPDHPQELDLPDTRAAIKWFRGAGEAGLEQILYTSSTAVHRPYLPVMDEGSPMRSNDFYGATKVCGESFLSAVSHEYPIRCNVIRPGPVVGPPAFPGGPHKSDRRFAEFIRQASGDEPIHLAAGEGRQFVGVVDLARLYKKVLESGMNREAFIAVSRDTTPWSQIARDVVEAMGSRSEIVEDLPGAADFRFDVAKIERCFGFRFDASAAMGEHIRHMVDSRHS